MTYLPPPEGPPYQPPTPPGYPAGPQYAQQPGYPPGYGPPVQGHQAPKKSHTARNVILAIVGVLVIIVVIAAIAGGGDKKKDAAATSSSTAVSASTSKSSSAAAPPVVQSSTPKPTPTPTLTVFKVGTPVPVTENNGSDKATITVNSIKLAQTTNNQFEKPSNGQFVVADVTIQCTAGEFDYGPYDYTVTTPDLRSWQSTVGWFEPALHSATLTAGQAIRGNVTFDVQAGAITAVNLGSGGFSGKIIASWTP